MEYYSVRTRMINLMMVLMLNVYVFWSKGQSHSLTGLLELMLLRPIRPVRCMPNKRMKPVCWTSGRRIFRSADRPAALSGTCDTNAKTYWGLTLLSVTSCSLQLASCFPETAGQCPMVRRFTCQSSCT